MPAIHVTFTNDHGESRQLQIWDVGADPNSPQEIFNGPLDPYQTTQPIPVHSHDFGSSRIQYRRPDGGLEDVDNLSEGDNVRLT